MFVMISSVSKYISLFFYEVFVKIKCTCVFVHRLRACCLTPIVYQYF